METLTDSTIKDFAAAVRAELKDLPKATIDELTGDLEASLAERQADEGENFSLGSPVDFAAELRDAAGVQPKVTKSRIFSSEALLSNLETSLRNNRLTSGLLEFGISIRPLWWVIRAVVAWVLIFGFVLEDYSRLAFLAVMIFLSIQWGRGKWFSNRFFKSWLLPLNVLAILTLPIAGLLVGGKLGLYYSFQDSMRFVQVDGLRLEGNPVTELKAYNSDDVEVEGLRFTDQNGNPINLPIPLSELTQYLVPDVIGMSYEASHEALIEAGIPGVDYIYRDNVNEKDAVVVSIEPPAGSAVTSRDVVTITYDRK